MGLPLGQERIGSTGGFGSCFVAVVKFDLIRLELEGRFATVIFVQSLKSNIFECEINKLATNTIKWYMRIFFLRNTCQGLVEQ